MDHPEIKLLEDLTLHRFFGLQNLQIGKGTASFEMVVSENTINIFGKLHGGVFYGLCDLAAYMALLSELKEAETAVTQDIHLTIMRPGKMGDRVLFTGELVQMGKNIIFTDGKAWVNGKLMASAHVTKSIVSK